MMSTAKKSKYQTYGMVYSKQCVNCLKEGTYKCALEVVDDECKNFTTVKKGDKIFGGY